MSLKKYRVVWDVLEDGLTLWPLALLVLGACVAAGVLLFSIKRKKPQGLILFVIMTAGLSMGLLVYGVVAMHQIRCIVWARSGKCQVAEGVVKDFHPMPYSGHDSERFTVSGVKFEYSDYDLSGGGFNNTSSHGGPMMKDLQVRITHKNGQILKLEVLEGSDIGTGRPAVSPMFGYLLAVAGLCFALLIIGGFLTYDKLLRLQYEEHREAWEQDGRPSGAFWRPKEPRGLRSWLAFQRTYFKWTWKTPEWARDDAKALRLLRRWRIIQLGGLATWLVFAVAFVLHGLAIMNA